MAKTINHIMRTRIEGPTVSRSGGRVPFAVWPMILQT
jgi:hypothetical protein